MKSYGHGAPMNISTSWVSMMTQRRFCSVTPILENWRAGRSVIGCILIRRRSSAQTGISMQAITAFIPTILSGIQGRRTSSPSPTERPAISLGGSAPTTMASEAESQTGLDHRPAPRAHHSARPAGRGEFTGVRQWRLGGLRQTQSLFADRPSERKAGLFAGFGDRSRFHSKSSGSIRPSKRVS